MNKYKILNKYMVRTPFMPDEVYKNLYLNQDSKQKIKDMVTKNEIREVVTVASKSLAKSLANLKEESTPKKQEQTLESVSRYLNRMTTRTTPYGLCAGVALGEFGEETNIKLKDYKQFKKIARPDMEWLYGVIGNLEKDQEVLNKLRIKANPLIYKKGTRLEIPYISNLGQVELKENDSITATIRSSFQVENVIELTKEMKNYSEVVKEIMLENKNVEKKVVEKFLNQLIKNEYLLTELRPRLSNIDVFNYILEKIKDMSNNIYYELLEIKKLLDKYNLLEIGEGIYLYLEIQERMKLIYECENLIQVDMRINAENIELDKTISENLEKVLNFACMLSSNKKYQHIEEYIDDFGEVYGFDREVKLLELLDSDLGMGAPAGYTKPASSRILKSNVSPESPKIKELLKEKFVESCKLGINEIVLTDEDLNSIEDEKIEKMKLPDSLEIYAMLRKNDKNKYNIHISPNQGASVAGKTFGRFGHLFSNEFREHLKEINRLEKNASREYIFAELIELPQGGRISNVSINCNERDYELNIGTYGSEAKIQLDIDDIYVGVDYINGEKNLYFKSKKYKKRIKFSATNMLNHNFFSNISRFLIEGSMYSEKNIFEFFYTCDLDEFIYSPKVRYKNIIIVPAKWKLRKKDLINKNDKFNLDKVVEKFKLWKKKWNVSKLVYLKEGDNRLLFNLDNEYHIRELLTNLQKKDIRELELTEFEDELDNLIVESPNGRYFAEFVFPFIKNQDEVNEKESLIEKNKYIKESAETYSINRNFILGDEWVYFKIYGLNKRKEDFIGYYLDSLYKQLYNNDYIDKFFFIQYGDPDFHIRIRFKMKDKKNIGYVISIINQWTHKIMGEGLCKKIVFDSYSRELERYGGVELIEEAEEVFFKDSLYNIEIIRNRKIGKLKIEEDKLAVISIINLMTEMGMNFEEQKNLFYRYFHKNEYRKEFQKCRRDLMKLGNIQNDWQGLRSSEEGNIIYNLFDIRKKALKDFANKIKKLNLEIDEILLSIIHMYCNRMGLSRSKETYVMQLVRHTLQSLEYLNKGGVMYGNSK